MVDINTVEQVLKLTKQIKELEETKKILTDSLKADMLASGEEVINHNGSKIQLVKTTKFSIKKNMKDKFLLFLKDNNLSSCITINPDVNKDTLETEIAIGNISKDVIKQYANFSEVNSIRVTL